MSNPGFDQLAAAQKANAEVMMALVRTAFNGVERLTALNISASREFFNNSVANVHQLLSARDAGEITKLNTELAKPNLDKWMEYSRNVYDLAAQVQKELTSVVETQFNTFAKDASSAVEKASASAPMGGDVFAAAMKSVLDASSKAFDNMTAVTRQFTDLAEANLQAASSSTGKAASATSAAAKKAAK
ncbi:MAG: phasin family protein [Rhodocyclaceae bacterium]|nr:phasin family protein [Rhodocyclaceae bacterium]